MLRQLILCLLFFAPQLYAYDQVIVGIAGGSGSGKTTLAEKLHQYFGESVVLIQQDSYYKDLSSLSVDERAGVNFDHPGALDFALLKQHLTALKHGQPVDKPVYDFKIHCRTAEIVKVNPKPIILVEGILVLAMPEIRELFDLKIYVDTDDDIRILRRLQRDITERGRNFDDVKNQYISTVKPMHKMFVEPSKNHADVVVWGITENFPVVTSLISGFLEGDYAAKVSPRSEAKLIRLGSCMKHASEWDPKF